MIQYPSSLWPMKDIVKCWVVLFGGVLGGIISGSSLLTHAIGFIIGIPVAYIAYAAGTWFIELCSATIIKVYKNKTIENDF